MIRNIIIFVVGACSICNGANLTMIDEDFAWAFRYHQGLCYGPLPGERLDIIYSDDEETKDAIMALLASKSFDRPYSIYSFDCTDMAVITQIELQRAGYDTKLALSIPSNKSLAHVWDLVNRSDGWIGIDPTGDLPRLGVVYGRWTNWIHAPKTCIILNDSSELSVWYPQLDFSGCALSTTPP